MNSKLLFAATVAVSLAGSLAMADQAVAGQDAPLTRAQVRAEYAAAAADGTLRRTDYDDVAADRAVSTRSRADVVAEIGAAKAARRGLIGPFANASYNPFGTQILATSQLSRAEVRADVRQAAAEGTLHRTGEADAAPGATRRVAAERGAPTLAQRIQGALGLAAS